MGQCNQPGRTIIAGTNAGNRITAMNQFDLAKELTRAKLGNGVIFFMFLQDNLDLTIGDHVKIINLPAFAQDHLPGSIFPGLQQL